MIVLALDTATPNLALGLLELHNGYETLALEHNEPIERGHAEVALDRIATLFERAERSPRADRIVVGSGPGSYTGVRIGISLALGLARGWNAAVVGVPTLEAIAVGISDGVVGVTLDTRRGSVYSAVYRVAEGQVLETLMAIEKRTLEEFRACVPDGVTWIEDGMVGGVRLARIGMRRNEQPIEPVHL